MTTTDPTRGRAFTPHPSKQRRSAIAALVRTEGTVRIEELAHRFAVSTMTIHRDLDALDGQGLVRKVRSGAEALPSEVTERNVAVRENLHLAQKQAVAAAGLAWAAEQVAMRAVAVDDSTTALQVLPLLEPHLPLTVVTNFLPAITALAAEPRVTLHAVGGEHVAQFASFEGAAALQTLGSLHYDVLFTSVPAVTRGACFHPSSSTAELKRAYLRSAELRVLLVDHSKFERRAVHRICDLTEFDAVVVDAGLGRAVDELRESGVNVVVADEATSVGGAA